MKKQVKIFALSILILILLYANIFFIRVYIQDQVSYSPGDSASPDIPDYEKRVFKSFSILLVFVIASIIIVAASVYVMYKVLEKQYKT